MVKKFVYLINCITARRMFTEIENRKAEARTTLVDLHHSWHRRLSFSEKGRIRNATAMTVILYNRETWPNCVEDIHAVSICNHRFFLIISGMC
ncbi:hypothetical protein AHF37_09195 [Paragonimus kellicotti]|nr:hypothetical protein AHF37_09195 [Paragonimus kellicotti]